VKKGKKYKQCLKERWESLKFRNMCVMGTSGQDKKIK
jgi:hypothetical protein